MPSSVREYAILYVGGGKVSRGSVGGGNVMLNAGQHALDGPEHTGQLPADRVSYDNTTSGLTADDVQAAIDELDTRDEALEAEIAGIQGGLVPVMATSPNLVTTDGTAVWIPLVLADGSPVMVEA